MKKILQITSLFLFLLFAQSVYAVNEECAAGIGPCPDPPDASVCTAPPIIQNVGGCPGGTVWIGNASTGSCTLPSYSPSGACPPGTDSFLCETNTCYNKPVPGPPAVCPTSDVNTGGSLPCCTDDQVTVRDSAYPTGWKCEDKLASLWSQNGSDIYYDSGNVGIGINTPTHPLTVREFSGGIATLGWNAISATGNQAFAVGDSTVAVGDHSVAMGISSTAQGHNSFAMGTGVNADGAASVALGSAAWADGDISFAQGQGAWATGLYSVGMGLNSRATGQGSLAIGSGATASGTDAIALGGGATASGPNSLAIGLNNEALLNSSVALGSNTDATGLYATAMGRSTLAAGTDSTAMGNNSDATGNGSTAMGQQTISSGIASLSTGVGTTASGDQGVAMGNMTIASGYTSVAMGRNTLASGNASVASGNGSRAVGYYSSALGFNTYAQPYASVVLGQYNEISGDTANWVATDPVFVIGNGDSGTPHNAVTVLKNGNMGIGNSFPSARVHATGSTYGVWGEGSSMGGLFLDTNSSGYAYIANNDGGISAYGNVAGGFFGDLDSSGYAYVGYGDYGIRAVGDWAGGYFTDNGASSVTQVAYGDEGINAQGDSMGGYFADSNQSGYAKVGFGNRGIDGFGTHAGGYFVDWDSSGYAYVGVGDAGVIGYGDTQGGSFHDRQGTSYAYTAYGNYGVWALGDTMGGYFKDNNATGYAYLGYGDRGMRGYGSFAGATFSNTVNTSRWVDLGKADQSFVANSDAIIQNGTDNNGAAGTLKIYNGGSLMLLDGNEIDARTTAFGNAHLYLNHNSTSSTYKTYVRDYAVDSDRRLKEDIQDIGYGLDDVLAMRPVSFKWKDQENDGVSFGFIAQEMEPVVGEIITTHARPDDPSMLGIEYIEIVPILTAAIQELKAEKDELQDAFCELKPDAKVCIQ